MQYLQENYLFIITLLFAIYEVVIRFYPTVKNNSIIDLLHKILTLFLPNKKKDNFDNFKIK